MQQVFTFVSYINIGSLSFFIYTFLVSGYDWIMSCFDCIDQLIVVIYSNVIYCERELRFVKER